MLQRVVIDLILRNLAFWLDPITCCSLGQGRSVAWARQGYSPPKVCRRVHQFLCA